MTVAELIAELSKLDPTKEVLVSDYEYGECTPYVEDTDDGKVILSPSFIG